MRIEPTEKPPGIRPASSARPDATPSSAHALPDQVDLSLLSRSAAGLNPERLEQIQSRVRSGAYQSNPAELSRSIVDFYLIPIE